MNRLSAEIISLVTDYLDETDLYTCTFINKHFYTITNPLLWRSIHFDTELLKRFSRLLLSQSPHQHNLGQHIRHLGITNDMTDILFLLLLPRVPRLTTLTMWGTRNISDASFLRLPHYCPHLQLIDIHETTLSPHTFSTVCQQLPLLDTLHLLGFSLAKPPTLFSSFGDHHPLKTMRILATYWMTQQTPLDMIRSFGDLTTLRIDYLSDTIAQQLVLLHSSSPWPRLTSLSIGNVNDDTMIFLITTHPQLKLLGLSGNQFTDLTLYTIGMSLSPVLTTLLLFDNELITCAALYRLVKKCGMLTEISIQNCHVLELGFPELDLAPQPPLSYQLLDHATFLRLRRVLSTATQQP